MTDAYGFVATAAGVYENEDCLVAALDSGADAYLTFQRHPVVGHSDDDGVYVEIDDQINAGYSIVVRCVLTPGSIRVSLSRPLKGFTTLSVSLSIPKYQFAEFQQMLIRIFAGHENLLDVKTRPKL